MMQLSITIMMQVKGSFFWVILCLALCVAVPNDDFYLRYLFVVLYCQLKLVFISAPMCHLRSLVQDPLRKEEA